MENLREKKERSLVVGLIALIVIIVVLAFAISYCDLAALSVATIAL